MGVFADISTISTFNTYWWRTSG